MTGIFFRFDVVIWYLDKSIGKFDRSSFVIEKLIIRFCDTNYLFLVACPSRI